MCWSVSTNLPTKTGWSGRKGEIMSWEKLMSPVGWWAVLLTGVGAHWVGMWLRVEVPDVSGRGPPQKTNPHRKYFLFSLVSTHFVSLYKLKAAPFTWKPLLKSPLPSIRYNWQRSRSPTDCQGNERLAPTAPASCAEPSARS